MRMGIVPVAPLAARVAGSEAVTITFTSRRTGRQRGQLDLSFGVAVFNDDVLAIDVAQFAQSLLERREVGRRAGVCGRQIANSSNPAGPLRTRRQRPRRRAAERG